MCKTVSTRFCAWLNEFLISMDFGEIDLTYVMGQAYEESFYLCDSSYSIPIESICIHTLSLLETINLIYWKLV